MKMTVRATVIFEWEEDSKNHFWSVDTKEEFFALIKERVEDDPSYLEFEPESIVIEEVK
jgi:hypothetical protein